MSAVWRFSGSPHSTKVPPKSKRERESACLPQMTNQLCIKWQLFFVGCTFSTQSRIQEQSGVEYQRWDGAEAGGCIACYGCLLAESQVYGTAHKYSPQRWSVKPRSGRMQCSKSVSEHKKKRRSLTLSETQHIRYQMTLGPMFLFVPSGGRAASERRGQISPPEWRPARSNWGVCPAGWGLRQDGSCSGGD